MSILSDLADEEHDRKVLFENLVEDTLFVHASHPCPCPDLCDIRCNRCTECGRKAGLSPATIKMKLLREAAEGGMVIGRAEIGHCQWAMLGKTRGPRMF